MSEAFQADAFQILAFQYTANLPPTLLDQIPNLSAAYNSGTHQYDLAAYFAGATSYAIAPALEAGWSFNTGSGLLTIDTDAEGTSGPYTGTAMNANGDTDSNAFLVVVSAYHGGYESMHISIDTGI